MLNSLRAALQVWAGRRGAFERTPKYGITARAQKWESRRYYVNVDRLVVFEILLALFNLGTVWLAWQNSNWLIALYAAIFAAGIFFNSERLRAFHFFREFSDVEIWEIVRLSEWRNLEVGTVVMKEGEPGNYFCVLVGGRLRVLKQGHLLNTLSPGDCFGEMALFSAGRGTRTSSVEATSEACILTIRAPSLLRASAVCQMHFYKGFLEVLATRLAVANNRIGNV